MGWIEIRLLGLVFPFRVDIITVRVLGATNADLTNDNLLSDTIWRTRLLIVDFGFRSLAMRCAGRSSLNHCISVARIRGHVL